MRTELLLNVDISGLAPSCNLFGQKKYKAWLDSAVETLKEIWQGKEPLTGENISIHIKFHTPSRSMDLRNNVLTVLHALEKAGVFIPDITLEKFSELEFERIGTSNSSTLVILERRIQDE